MKISIYIYILVLVCIGVYSNAQNTSINEQNKLQLKSSEKEIFANSRNKHIDPVFLLKQEKEKREIAIKNNEPTYEIDRRIYKLEILVNELDSSSDELNGKTDTRINEDQKPVPVTKTELNNVQKKMN